MLRLLEEMGKEYDLVLLDMPPVNVVTDPLVLSSHVAGCLFVARQNYSDHRDLKKALSAAELTGMNVMGFVFYGEELAGGGHYGYYSKRYYRKYYKNYYSKYDNRSKNAGQQDVPVPASTGVNQAVNPVSHNKNGETQNS
jgi:Mrp family chromosome partitioning ATPase